MKKRNVALMFAAFFILGMMLFSVVSMAYVDPTTATILFSAISAVVVAISGGFAIFSRKLKKKFKKNKDEGDSVKSLSSDEDGFDDSDFDSDK